MATKRRTRLKWKRSAKLQDFVNGRKNVESLMESFIRKPPRFKKLLDSCMRKFNRESYRRFVDEEAYAMAEMAEYDRNNPDFRRLVRSLLPGGVVIYSTTSGNSALAEWFKRSEKEAASPVTETRSGAPMTSMIIDDLVGD